MSAYKVPKVMTFITIIEDENGGMVDFERFYCKRQSTVERQIRELYTEHKWIYKKYLEKGVRVACYRTPDGYNHEQTPIWTIPTKELIA